MADSKLAVFGAIAANVAIAVMKFVGAAATGSSAMLSEGIHSLVDTGDGLLLLVGMNLSAAPADERHPFGHGKELYFWSLIVAVLIFGVGGGVSVYEGILRLLDPRPLEDAGWNYVDPRRCGGCSRARAWRSRCASSSARSATRRSGGRCSTQQGPDALHRDGRGQRRARRPRRGRGRRLGQPLPRHAGARRRRLDRHRLLLLRRRRRC